MADNSLSLFADEVANLEPLPKEGDDQPFGELPEHSLVSQEATPYAPRTGLSAEEQLEVQTKREEAAPGFRESIELSLSLDGSGAAFGRAAEMEGFPIDLSFDPSEYMKTEEGKKALEQIPTELWERFGEATSKEHFDWMVNQAKVEMATELALNDAGVTGFLSRTLVNLVDPVNLGLTVATAPIGGAGGASRLGNIAKSALASGGSVAAYEEFLRKYSMTRTFDDTLLASTGAALLGGTLTALAPGIRQPIERTARDLGKELEGEAVDTAKKFRSVFGKDTLSAARARPVHETIYEPTEKVVAKYAGDSDSVEQFGAQLSWGMAARLSRSANETVRKLGARLLEGGPLADKAATRRFTAEGRANLIERTQLTKIYRELDPLYKEWAKENGHGVFGRNFLSGPGEQFRTEVGMAVQGIRDVKGKRISPQAHQAAEVVRRVLDDQRKLLIEAGVVDDLPANPNYLPHFHNHTRIRELVQKYGERSVVQTVFKAISRDDLPDDVLWKIADGYVRKVRQTGAGVNLKEMDGIPLDDLEYLRVLLEDEADYVIDVLENLKKSRTDGPQPKNLKRRLEFDMTYHNGDYGIADLFENDAGRVLDLYFRSTSGMIGLAKEANIKNLTEVQETINAVKAMADEQGNITAQEVANVEASFKLLLGQTLESDAYSGVSQVARAVRDFNFARVMGQVGFAQIAELGNIIGYAGFTNMMKQMPDFGAMLRRARNGKLEDDLADELETLFASGTDWLRSPLLTRHDELGLGYDTKTAMGKTLHAVDPAVQSMRRFTAVSSGLLPITVAFQRLASKSAAQKIAKFAKGKGELTDAQKARLYDIGWDDDMQKRIFDSIRQLGKTDRKGKLVRLNVERWEPEVRDAYAMGMNRLSRRIVQENDIGNTHPFMHSTLGKVLFQFRSFVINAWTKQTLHAIHFRDREAFVAMMGSMFFGGLAYVAQTAANYGGDTSELERRLKPKKIATESFRRAGMSSLMPSIWDTAAQTAGFGPTFGYGGSTGRQANFILGNPTVTFASDVAQLTSLPLSLLHDDYSFSQEDAALLQRNIVGTKLLGISTALNAATEKLPARSREPDYDND